MSNALIQFREDEGIKKKASMICESLGIDLPTYLRICIFKLIAEEGIPFDMKVSPGFLALTQSSLRSKKLGKSDISLDEINEEINEVRKSKK